MTASARHPQVRLTETNRIDQWSALMMSTLTEPKLNQQWEDWFNAHLARHRKTDSALTLEIARYAADGIWMAALQGERNRTAPPSQALRAALIGMTKKKP